MPSTEVPEDAENQAILTALRQAWTLVNSQNRFFPDGRVRDALGDALHAIGKAAAAIKELA
jgi:hypothetical protein